MTNSMNTLLALLPGRLLLFVILSGWLAGCAPAPTPTATTMPQTIQTFALALSGTVLMLNGQPGDPDGSGSATVTINLETNEICWEITASAITLPARDAHIHRAPLDQDGPAVIHLTVPDENGQAEGCTTGQIAQELLNHPANFAVLVHTSDYVAGALRAQLGP